MGCLCAAIATVQSVSVRDVGTEMTPIPSQEPSRTGTPLGSMTPTQSPNCSIPSTPVGGRSVASPGEDNIDDGPYFNRKGGTYGNEMSDTEMRLKTRQEIAALGIQLGKMNIATWARKEELELVSAAPSIADLEQMKKEYATRAASYEEAENTKHTARYYSLIFIILVGFICYQLKIEHKTLKYSFYSSHHLMEILFFRFKKEEVKIEAWESHQRVKIEFEMRRIEVHFHFACLSPVHLAFFFENGADLDFFA